MRRAATTTAGVNIGYIGDTCYPGKAHVAVITSRMGMNDTRGDHEINATISITLNTPDAQHIAGRRVAIFLIEDD